MKELDRIPNIPQVQEEILKFWKEDKTFEKSLQKPDGKEIDAKLGLLQNAPPLIAVSVDGSLIEAIAVPLNA